MYLSAGFRRWLDADPYPTERLLHLVWDVSFAPPRLVAVHVITALPPGASLTCAIKLKTFEQFRRGLPPYGNQPWYQVAS